ncbi:MAG: hypothetical protein H6747_09600 [Deltaproteobacteria bacterium]|nr:hypothetical protein [Deltaproteobacteria bacterium]
MGNPWSTSESSLLLAIQDDLTTPNTTSGDFVALKCETPKISFDTRVDELALLTGQPGAAPERVVGGRSGKITFSVPMEGLASTYAPVTEQPGVTTGVVSPWFCLAANMLGSDVSNLAGATLSDRNANFWLGSFAHKNSGYAADDVASATSTVVTVDAASGTNYHEGEFLVSGEGTSETSPQMGFIKSIAADALTLFEASANTKNSNTAETFATLTAYASSDQPRPLTARYVGSSSAAYGYILTGLVGESFKISLDSAEVPIIEFVFRFADFEADSTIGGLVVPDDYNRVSPIVGTSNGRATLAGSLACGLEGVSLEFSATLAERKCHSATQGIYSIDVVSRRISVTATIPHDSTDAIYDPVGAGATQGSHKWQSYLQRSVAQSFGIYTGAGIGRIFSALVPAGKLTAVPQLTEAGGLLAYQVSMEASSYSGDGSSTAPGNTVARLALA